MRPRPSMTTMTTTRMSRCRSRKASIASPARHRVTDLPTDEQRQRAKWDLLLLDIEHRTEQLRQLKAYEPQQLNLLLLDLEHRAEQVRQLKTYEPWRLVFAGLTTGAVILGVGIALG